MIDFGLQCLFLKVHHAIHICIHNRDVKPASPLPRPSPLKRTGKFIHCVAQKPILSSHLD